MISSWDDYSLNELIKFIINSKKQGKNEIKIIFNIEPDLFWIPSIYHTISLFDIPIKVEKGYLANNALESLFIRALSEPQFINPHSLDLPTQDRSYGRDINLDTFDAFIKSIQITRESVKNIILQEVANSRTNVKTEKDDRNVIIPFCQGINKASINSLLETCRKALEKNITDIILLIASTGGSTEQGIRGYQGLREIAETLRKKTGGNMITVNMGRVESAAVSIFCAGDKRLAFNDSIFSIHKNIWGNSKMTYSLSQLLENNAKTAEQNIKVTKILEDTLGTEKDYYGTSFKDILNLHERYYTTEEAKKMNLITHDSTDLVINHSAEIILLDSIIKYVSFGRPNPVDGTAVKYFGVSEAVFKPNRVMLQIDFYNEQKEKVNKKSEVTVQIKNGDLQDGHPEKVLYEKKVNLDIATDKEITSFFLDDESGLDENKMNALRNAAKLSLDCYSKDISNVIESNK